MCAIGETPDGALHQPRAIELNTVGPRSIRRLISRHLQSIEVGGISVVTMATP